jgi:flagellar M-ring protein FliF
MKFVRSFIGVLAQLGVRRLALLGLVGAVVFASLFIGAYYLNRPVRDVLYTGLDTEDINRIGAVLSELAIPYDISVTGNSVLVDFGRTAEARMILAERGLPKSDKSGYELFDQMGSLGLTSFMQQVTRVRVLEGELSRTIRLLDGIRSARVHLGLKTEGTFRAKADQPTASVVIKTDGTAKVSLAGSVRQIVAAAIPGLKSEQVTVMTTDGQTLLAGGDATSAEPDRQLDLEKRIANDIRTNAETAIAAIIGSRNLRISATAQLNSDRRQVTETKFDPESRVERSLRTVKETDDNQNSKNAGAVTVAQNIPQEIPSPSAGDTTRESKIRKEEIANYEINSTQMEVASVGYTVQKLSLAVLLNRSALLGLQGGSEDEAKMNAQISEIEQLVKSAVGFNEKRGDLIKVSAVKFVEEEDPDPSDFAPGFMDILVGNLGTIINAVSLITASLLVILLGLRPTVKAILSAESNRRPSQQQGALSSAGSGEMRIADMSNSVVETTESSKGKLNKAVEVDVDRAAQVLKQWIGKANQVIT